MFVKTISQLIKPISQINSITSITPITSQIARNLHLTSQYKARDIPVSTAMVNPEKSPAHFIAGEVKYGSTNYKPMPVVIERGQGCNVWDVTGRRYLDFLACFATMAHGYSHPRILAAITEQASKITLTSRVFYHNKLAPFQELLCKTFGFDKMMPTNTGVEATESAVKLARRWAYDVKGVQQNQAVVLFPRGNFWGRSIAAVSASTDPSSYGGYGPYVPHSSFQTIPYNDIPAFETVLKSNPNIAAYVLEAIQGEAGVIVPREGYLSDVRALCTKYNVLMVVDEVQTGLGRTGKPLAVNYEDVKPDMLTLGKALSGGVMPVSCVLGREDVITTIKPGQHGSTFGGNPLGCAIGIEAIKVLFEEGLIDNSFAMGEYLRSELRAIQSKLPHLIKEVRGKGLLNAVEVNPDVADAGDLCTQMVKRGLLVKPTHGTVIRMSPALVVTKEQIDEAVGIMYSVFSKY